MSFLWFTKAIAWDWITDGMFLTITTNNDTHLGCRWTLTPPVKLPFYRWQRGLRTRCGWTWKLLDCVNFDQIEPGWQATKTFSVTPWPPGRQAWWYFHGHLRFSPAISTSVIYTDTFPGGIGPPVPAAPEVIIAAESLIRNGNHYSFWTGDNYYTVLPFSNLLRIFKRTAPGTWVPQDVPNEPTPAPWYFADADARLSSDHLTLHIVAYLKNPWYPSDFIRYYTYDITTDTWQLDELIRENDYPWQPNGHCSISLDSNDKPAVLYERPTSIPAWVTYEDRILGFWANRIGMFNVNSTYRGMSVCHDIIDTFHAAIVAWTGSDLLYRSRPVGGPLGPLQNIDGTIANPWPPSIDAWTNLPNVAVTDWDLTLEHIVGPAPWTHHLAIYPPVARYPTVLTPEPSAALIHIIFAKDDLIPHGISWKLGVWTPWAIPDIDICSQIAATTVTPALASYIATVPAPAAQTRFWVTALPQ